MYVRMYVCMYVCVESEFGVWRGQGDRVEAYFGGGAATITTVTSNTLPSSALRSGFVNTAEGLKDCTVNSWLLGL